MDLAALRVDAVEYRLDGTVLAGRIHALQDQQHRPAVLRVKLFLKIAQAFSVGIEDLFRLVLVEAALLVGLVRLEMELTRPVEAERRNEGPQLIAKILRRLLAHDVSSSDWRVRTFTCQCPVRGGAACYVAGAAAEVGEVGRARRKIDTPGIRGMLAHFAQYERAVGTAQRAHSEAVEHAPIRKAPVAPCQEACEIGVEIAGAEAVASENRIACQQNPPIPDFRFLALLDREMRLDLSSPLFGERPRPRAYVQIKSVDAMNRDRQHRPPPAYIWPAATFFTKRSSNVLFRSILASFISGSNCSKRFSPFCIPCGVMMPVLEYIGFEALNAER